ncbi:MAG: phage major capsid protein, partial [Parvularcula sp.]|nr:phage major capsid protein [Parvularcula sp.]
MNPDFIKGLRAAHEGLSKTVQHFEGKTPDPAQFKDQNGTPRPFIHPHANKGGSSLAPSGAKVHHGAHGEVFELKSGTPLSSVVPVKEQAEVPLERWLAATMLGDRCEDKTALAYANETKSLSGGATGVLLPQAFQGPWIDNLRSFMVLEAAGMTTATMGARTVTSSRVVSDPPVSWRAEGASLAAGDPTFELRNLVANSLAVRVQATAELA